MALDEKENIFIFDKDKVKIVIIKNDNSKKIYDNGTYEVKDTYMGKEIRINVQIDEDSSVGFIIYLNKDGTIKEYQTPLDEYSDEEKKLLPRVIKIVPNNKNGINPNTQTSSASNSKEIVVNTANDLKGYKIVSNETSSAYIHQFVSYTFNCDGSYDYILKTWGNNTEVDKRERHGKEIIVNYGESIMFNDSDADSIYLTGDNKLIQGHCMYSTNSDGSCFSGFIIKELTHTKCN